jgi:hypothetical protein
MFSITIAASSFGFKGMKKHVLESETGIATSSGCAPHRQYFLLPTVSAIC